jgi:peptidyl-dipeptidase Dcp
MSQETNPLLGPWNTPYGLPPFDKLLPAHFGPAFDAAMAEQDAELAAIASSREAPSFENTIAAFDKAGAALSRVFLVFDNLTSSNTDEALQAVEREYSPRLSRHKVSPYLDQALFARVEAVHEARLSSGLTPVQRRLVEKIHLDFVLAGARLDEAGRKRTAELVEELSAKCIAFAQAVLADEEEAFVLIEDPSGLEGLPPDLVAAAAEAAKARGLEGKWAITVGRSFVEPFLASSKRRDLREKVWKAFALRGEMRPDRDTKPLIKEILELRTEKARIHGFASYADCALVNRMAKKPAKVAELLEAVWGPALARAKEEEALLGALAKEADGLAKLEAWDWLYYSDQVKRRDYSLDEAAVKRYFSVDSMMKAMFWAAGRLFGVDFEEVKGLPLYHPDVRLFEVRDRASGSLKGLFLSDNYSRAGKRSGAWMNNYRDQCAGVVPIVVNNNNFTRGEGGATLISFDDATTLFHEFGHALHGLLSDVEYQSLSGTNVLRDFVELPSQLFEHWALVPEVLARFAIDAQTGKPIPSDLVDLIKKTRVFNMGWTTVQYLGPALLDMGLHSLRDPALFEAGRFEAEECARLGVPAVVGLRHRLPHFQHLFSGEEYAAGYYAYMWAEVLEADVFSAFEEKGDPFDPELAAALKRCIYASGNSADPAEAFRAFRGREPAIGALLRQRGLA